MPITAKLSRKLYEAFGDEAAGEMIDWMQRVDTYPGEFRQLNELTISRFEARLGEFEARVEAGFARMDGKLADLRRETETGLARLEMKIEQRTADIMKWSFVFWVGSAVTLVGALATLGRFLR